MQISTIFFVAAGLIAASAMAAQPVDRAASSGGPRLAYPSAHRGNQVDDYHGIRVADPYRGLEDIDSAELRRGVL